MSEQELNNRKSSFQSQPVKSGYYANLKYLKKAPLLSDRFIESFNSEIASNTLPNIDKYTAPEIDIFPSLALTFDDISNAYDLVGTDIYNPYNWNLFFGVENSGTPFTSVSISYQNNTVYLYGGTDIPIKEGLFRNYQHLVRIVDTAYTINSIYSKAFLNCSNLVDVNLPYCKNIFYTNSNDQGVFENCTNLENVILAGFEARIYTNAPPALFKNCTSLKNLFIPRFDEDPWFNWFDGITDTNIRISSTPYFSSSLYYTTLPPVNYYNVPTNNNITAYTNYSSVIFTFLRDQDVEECIPGINAAIQSNNFTEINNFLGANWSISSANIFSNSISINSSTQSSSLKAGLFEGKNIIGFRDSMYSYYGRVSTIESASFKDSLLIDFRLGLDQDSRYSLYYIRAEAFKNCKYLKNVLELPYVKHIGDYSFQNSGTSYYSQITSSLNISTYSPNIEYVGTGSFYGSLFKTIKVGGFGNWYNPTARFYVGPEAFKNSLVQNINMPLVNLVGDRCFENCSNLTNLNLQYCNYLGSSVENNNVFLGINSSNITASIQDGFLYINSGSIDGDLNYLLSNNNVNSSYTTRYPVLDPNDSSGQSIVRNGLRIMFKYTSSLNSFFNNDFSTGSINTVLKVTGSAIDFRSSIIYNCGLGIHLLDGGGISLSSSMFAGNKDLIRFEDRDYSIVNVGEDVFNGCTNLKSAYLGTAVNIGSRAFKDCTSLNDTDFRYMHIVSASAFENCTSIPSFYSRDLKVAQDSAFKNTVSASSFDFPALTSVGDQCFSGSNNISYLNLPSLNTVGSTTGNNQVFSITGKNINLTITGSISSEGDIASLISNNTVTLDYPALILTFDSTGSVSALVSNTGSVSDWNTFFNLPTYGTPFTSVQVTQNVPLYENVSTQYPQEYGCQVKLYGGGNMTIAPSRFANYRKLRKLIDNGSTVVRVGNSAFSVNLNWWVNSGYATNLYGMMEISLPGCTYLENYAFYGNYETRRLNLPNLQYADSTNTMFSTMAWFSKYSYAYGPYRYSYDDFEDQIVSLPNLISIGGTGFLANGFYVKSFNLPKQTFIPTFTFAIAGWANTINIPEATQLDSQTFWSLRFYNIKVNMPKMANLGGSPAFNNIWNNNGGAFTGTYRFPRALMTINSGAPDGDIQAMQSGVRKILV